MSQLERHRDGLKMNELSRLLMVTGGNVTAIVDQLETEGLVERLDRRRGPARLPHPPDARRRAQLRRDGARARGMGGRAARRPVAPRAGRAAQPAGEGQAAHGGGPVMNQPKHFGWRVEGKVGVITLNRPERKNPLTFESYAELRDLFLDFSERRRSRHRDHRRRRQFLLRRRRARDHRPADQDGDAASSSTSRA